MNAIKRYELFVNQQTLQLSYSADVCLSSTMYAAFYLSCLLGLVRLTHEQLAPGQSSSEQVSTALSRSEQL